MSKIETLFYSESEGIAFYIPDHYPDTLKVHDQIKMLQEYSSKFARMLESGVRTDDMMSREIAHSSRYKSMRVWWMKYGKVPKGAFVITAGEPLHPDMKVIFEAVGITLKEKI